jgi:hypothetical protein
VGPLNLGDDVAARDVIRDVDYHGDQLVSVGIIVARLAGRGGDGQAVTVQGHG